MWILRSVTAVTGVCGIFPHATDATMRPFLFAPLLVNLDHERILCHIDKPRLSLENRRLSSLQWKAFQCHHS
jgi:hypothetical protein